jgi:hypothetical protein
MTLALVACTSSGLTSLRGLKGPFSCWLHFPNGEPAGLDAPIIGLARMGCLAFLVTGVGSAEIHDQIDDILENIQEPAIQTAWYDVVDQGMIWDFLNLDFGRDELPVRLLSVFSDSIAAELDYLGKLLHEVGGIAGQNYGELR